MAAKKDKMIPSEKERQRALKYATPAGTGHGKPHNSLPCMRHGDKPCHCHPGIPRFQSWEVSSVTWRTDMFANCPCGDIFASAA